MNLQLFYCLNSLAGKSAPFDAVIIFSANYLWWISLVLLVGVIWKKGYFKNDLQKSLSLIAMPFVAELITYILKHLVSAPRPSLIMTNIAMLITENGFDSFPSGHTTFMVALATVSFSFGRRTGILFSILALIVGISRIIAGAHFPIDIIGGACIGILIGFVGLKLHKKFLPNVL